MLIYGKCNNLKKVLIIVWGKKKMKTLFNLGIIYFKKKIIFSKILIRIRINSNNKEINKIKKIKKINRIKMRFNKTNRINRIKINKLIRINNKNMIMKINISGKRMKNNNNKMLIFNNNFSNNNRINNRIRIWRVKIGKFLFWLSK